MSDQQLSERRRGIAHKPRSESSARYREKDNIVIEKKVVMIPSTFMIMIIIIIIKQAKQGIVVIE